MLAPSRRPTAMCIVLSSKRSPHAESGNAFNQSPLCGALTACSRALSLLSLRLLVRVSRSDVMTGLSHDDCLCAMTPDGQGSPWTDDQVLLTEVTVGSVVADVALRMRSCCCSVSVPAADAKKAEGASEVTRRTPSPPSLTGRLA